MNRMIKVAQKIEREAYGALIAMQRARAERERQNK